MSENLVQLLDNSQIVPGFQTDHSIVVTTFTLCEMKKGPGYWKLNTSFLKDHNYVEAMNKLIDIELSQNQQLSYKDRQELLKLAIRGSSIQYATRKKKSCKLKVDVLEKKILKLEKELETPNPILRNTQEQLYLVKHELKTLMADKTRGAIIRSGMTWAHMGEKPT